MNARRIGDSNSQFNPKPCSSMLQPIAARRHFAGIVDRELRRPVRTEPREELGPLVTLGGLLDRDHLTEPRGVVVSELERLGKHAIVARQQAELHLQGRVERGALGDADLRDEEPAYLVHDEPPTDGRFHRVRDEAGQDLDQRPAIRLPSGRAAHLLVQVGLARAGLLPDEPGDLAHDAEVLEEQEHTALADHLEVVLARERRRRHNERRPSWCQGLLHLDLVLGAICRDRSSGC